ncbi:serine/threonine protein kinase [Aliikangiella marina]|uniref:non-specific serine/threonine protein kinase n=1 Tax=Aliikangiella marina TaxID=1712262 RepID=A0A545TBH9_9GAMM|nr:serine/threonine-protein kinase [Aliikangiella marina]TQV74565.1 serine/threonine protein kinase [Aliikangiella marina]
MKRNLLPLHRSGWLYLLMGIWGLLFWLNQTGAFHSANQINRNLLQSLLPSHQTTELSESSVVSLSTSFTGDELDKIKKLALSHPETLIVLMGNIPESLLAMLSNWTNQAPLKQPIFIAKKQQSSVSAISVGSETSIWTRYLLDWFRFPPISAPQWKTSNQLVFAPLGIDANNVGGGVPTVWQFEDKLYPTMLGAITRQILVGSNESLAADLSLRWQGANDSIQLGLSGKIFFADRPHTNLLLNDYLAAIEQQPNHSTQPLLVLIAEPDFQPLAQLAQSSQQLLSGRYLTENIITAASPIVLLIAGLFGLWLMREWSTKMQGFWIVCLLIIGAVGQYIAYTQMLWLSLVPVALTLILSWIIWSAYRLECQSMKALYQRHNLLIGDSLNVFYQSQSFDKVQPFLEQTMVDQPLAEKVFDVALRAESNNNLPLAKHLLSWLVDSDISHPASRQKLRELAPEPGDSGDQSLDSTMVITPGQSGPHTTSSMAIPVSHFGRYEVEGILGKGAMGIVYQGVDPKINRHVAIKTLQLTDSDDEAVQQETKERFFREAETAGNLSHANIVTIYDVGEEGELGYIAMDLLTGAPLSEFVKSENRLPAPFIYQLMIQITDALEYAHRQSVVHRDIKPGNIILDDEIQRVTVTDFGIAFVADNSKTRTGTIMGSPYYMSPEQVLGKRVDGRSDIFSLGVTFYQLLSGQLPFNGESIASVAYHITKTKQPSVRQWDSKLPASAARITNKALQKDVGKRYQTMEEFKQVLISALKRDFKKSPIV